jgi:quercetin dioxygenase-like cupin family protein
MTAPSRQIPAGRGTQFDWANDSVRVLSPAHLTHGATTVVEYTLKPGFFLARHHHKEATEVFFVLEGSVNFRLDDQSLTAGVGDTVNITPPTRHEVSAPDGARIITIFSPGGFDVNLTAVRELADTGANDADYHELAERFDIWQD